jgi:hypothetical protein
VAASLGAMQRDLRASLSGSESSAREVAHLVSGPRFDAVSAALQARSGADKAVKKALDAYTALVDQPGASPAQLRAANQAAVEALAIGQQALVGQFWTDPVLQAFLKGLPS